MIHWRAVYDYLHCHYYPDKRVHQLRLFHNGSTDLSHVCEGDQLHLLVTDPMVERWVSEYSLDSKEESCVYHHSTITWLDGRWGDPYLNPSIQYRTPLTLHVMARERVREQGQSVDFLLQASMPNESYGGHQGHSRWSEKVWYPTLREACHSFRTTLNEESGEEICTEQTIEHVIHLWELYHGTQQHVWDQGRYYE